MVDRTTYDAAKLPELALRQIFGRQRLSTGLCRLVADKSLLTVEAFAMLGDTIADVKGALKVIVGDDTLLGASPGEVELAVTSLAAVWKTCSTLQDHFAARRAKMEEDPTKVPEIPGDDHAEFREQFVTRHPDVLLPHHREPHRKLVERIQRDFLVHGAVPFYEVGEMRTRSEQIAQKSGLSKNAEDLLRVVLVDQPSAAASEAQVMDKLHAFLVALEYLNICEFTYAAGPLRYLSELEEWRQENHGLALLLSVDSLIRKKVYRLNSDQRKTFGSFSAALVEVLTNHKQLWNDARSSAELEKFKQAGHQAPTTPPRKRSHRDRSFKYSGKKRCPWFNCSLGCRFGDQYNARALIPVSSVVKTTRGTGTTEPQPMLAGRVRLHRPLQLARSHRTQMKFFCLFSQLNCTGSLIQSALHVCRSVGGVLSAMCSCPQPHSCRRAFGLEEGDTASALVHSTWSIVPHMTQRSCLSSL